MKIVLDAFGGDHAPEEIVKGGLLALQEAADFSLVLVGDEQKINAILAEESYDKARVEVVHAPEVITNDDVPTVAIKQKKESSLVVAFRYLKENEDAVGMVSAGSTGAVLTGGLFLLGRIRGIDRPALCPLLPTLKGGQVALIDCGANVDCKPINLVQFGMMGSVYARVRCGVEKPRVALLSNGTEDKKGNALNKEAFPLLKACKSINFVGNMEAREALSGDYDVIVTDGFAGNILLKGIEGAAGMVTKMLKTEIYSKTRFKIAALGLKPVFKKLKTTMDYNRVGGALFVGVQKVLVKSHGSSKRDAILASILQTLEVHKRGMIESIKEELAKMTAEEQA